MKLLRSFTFQSKVITEEGWRLQGNARVRQHFSCALATCKERNSDSFLAPKLAQLHQRVRVNVHGSLLSLSFPLFIQRVVQLLCSTLKTGGACTEDCYSWEVLSVCQSMMFYYTIFIPFSPVSGTGCFSLACKFTSICVCDLEVGSLPCFTEVSMSLYFLMPLIR